MAKRVDSGGGGATIEIFYSYSHKDEKLRDMLEIHLSGGAEAF